MNLKSVSYFYKMPSLPFSLFICKFITFTFICYLLKSKSQCFSARSRKGSHHTWLVPFSYFLWIYMHLLHFIPHKLLFLIYTLDNFSLFLSKNNFSLYFFFRGRLVLWKSTQILKNGPRLLPKYWRKSKVCVLCLILQVLILNLFFSFLLN